MTYAMGAGELVKKEQDEQWYLNSSPGLTLKFQTFNENQ